MAIGDRGGVTEVVPHKINNQKSLPVSIEIAQNTRTYTIYSTVLYYIYHKKGPKRSTYSESM